MNQKKIRTDNGPSIRQSLDEVGFQTSILALHLALEAAGRPAPDAVRGCGLVVETASSIESGGPASQAGAAEAETQRGELSRVAARLRRSSGPISTSAGKSSADTANPRYRDAR